VPSKSYGDLISKSCPRGYITITCLHKSAGWSVGTNQNHSAKNKINTSGGTGENNDKFQI